MLRLPLFVWFRRVRCGRCHFGDADPAGSAMISSTSPCRPEMPSARGAAFPPRLGSPAILTWLTPAAAARRCARRRSLPSRLPHLFSAVPIFVGSTRMENMPLKHRRPRGVVLLGLAAGERAAQQFADQRPGALVLAEGRAGMAVGLDHGVARVGGGVAVIVENGAGPEFHPCCRPRVLPCAILLVAKSSTIGSLPPMARRRRRGWCRGARPRPPQGDDGARQHVDEVDRHQAVADATARPRPMRRWCALESPTHAHAVAFGALGAEFHRLVARHPAVGLVAKSRRSNGVGIRSMPTWALGVRPPS